MDRPYRYLDLEEKVIDWHFEDLFKRGRYVIKLYCKENASVMLTFSL